MEEFVVQSLKRGKFEEKIEPVTEEVPLTINVKNQELATLLSSPWDLKNLVVGFLFTSGIIETFEAIRSLTIDEERWTAYVDTIPALPPEMLFKRIYTSGCGKGVLFHNPMDVIQRSRIPDGFTVAAGEVARLMKIFLKSSDEYRQTGGVHSCGLVGPGGMRVKDDIGRHNAMDKVIGEGLLNHVDFGEHMLFTSGRISSEILSKILRCRVPVLVSAGAPTNQAVKLAREANVSLLGFVRGSRMNVYSGVQRILWEQTR